MLSFSEVICYLFTEKLIVNAGYLNSSEKIIFLFSGKQNPTFQTLIAQ